MTRFILLRRRIVIGTLLLLLTGGIVAVYCGHRATTTAHEVGSVTETSYPVNVYSRPVSTETDGFFVDYRIEREVKRSRQVELLREIAAMSTTDEVIRKQAQERLIDLMKQTEREARVENLLRARGFRDAVAAVEDQGVTVIVKGRVTPEVNATVVALVYHSIGLAQEQVMVLGSE